MHIYDKECGRLGNAIFRYFASTLYCILYEGMQRTYDELQCSALVTDDDFIQFMHQTLTTNTPPALNHSESACLCFSGYFQHDTIFTKYRHQIIEWMQNNPHELLSASGDTEGVPCKAGELLFNPYKDTLYDIVVHLRLEDFLYNGQVMHPDSLVPILDAIYAEFPPDTKTCIVVKKSSTKIEQRYIDFFCLRYPLIVESNTPIADFHIMKNARCLVCSCSTLSWSASFLSTTLQTVYFPNYTDNRRSHETFKRPIDNTILYNFKSCSIQELKKAVRPRLFGWL
jgi:hypothetical protein